MPLPAPRVFISYSHDSPEHIDRVLALADRLRGEGSDARLDQYEVSPPQGWQLWMEEEIEAADFVLVVVTEAYLQRRRGRGASRDLGVRFEGAILSQTLYDNALLDETYIPVVFASEDVAHIPVFLKNATRYDLSGEEGYEGLYRHLTGQPNFEKPASGKLREPSPRRPHLEPEPTYRDEETRKLSEALNEAYRRQEELAGTGADLSEVNEQILELRRRIREGGTLKPGDFLAQGRFRLIEPLGKGGFATVFKAFDRHDRQLVAVKVLHGQYAHDRSRRERFFRGSRKMAQLQHQGIVRVIEPGLEEGGYYFFVMEMVTGGDLYRAVQEGRITDFARLRQVAEVLDFAHRSGVVHRDVKPANILLTEDGEAKLTDFDLVRAFDTTGGTRTGSMLGTFLYMAPEAMQQSKDVGAAADIYSLAMTAAFVIHGQELPPTAFTNPAAFFAELEVPPGVRKVLTRAASWEPQERPSSAGHLFTLLAAAAAPWLLLTKTEDWERRRRLYASVSESVDDPAAALAILERPEYATRNGNDLFFLERAVAAVAGRWPDFRRPAEELRGRLYDHIPVPPEALFKWIETRDGRVALWRQIPAGQFLMGSREGEEGVYDCERPQHRVVVRSPFRISAVPVTIAQYAMFDPEHCSFHHGDVPAEHIGSHPVEALTWYQANAFCRWLSSWLPGAEGARLPSEEEWEYACRAGSETRYWRGDDEADLEAVAWYGANSEGRTHRVGRKPANAWGLYDVHGNVWEWTSTVWRDDYSGRAIGIEIDPSAAEPAMANDGLFVHRGGSFWNDAGKARSAFRNWDQPQHTTDVHGFRVLLPGVGDSEPDLSNR